MTGSGLPDGFETALAAHGLIMRGGFAFGPDDAAPPGPSGLPARSVVLVGHGGGTIWPYFSDWLEAQGEPPTDPLDAWSRHVLEPAAKCVGARAVYPFERPWLPFQQWAMRAEGLRPSPLGILMHPHFGLWHAWRGALLFDADIGLQSPDNPVHLCDLCAGKNCMNACPVGAPGMDHFDVAACADHLALTDDCAPAGCHARAACPHDAWLYGEEQTAFHMAARLRGQKEN